MHWSVLRSLIRSVLVLVKDTGGRAGLRGKFFQKLLLLFVVVVDEIAAHVQGVHAVVGVTLAAAVVAVIPVSGGAPIPRTDFARIDEPNVLLSLLVLLLALTVVLDEVDVTDQSFAQLE